MSGHPVERDCHQLSEPADGLTNLLDQRFVGPCVCDAISCFDRVLIVYKEKDLLAWDGARADFLLQPAARVLDRLQFCNIVGGHAQVSGAFKVPLSDLK